LAVIIAAFLKTSPVAHSITPTTVIGHNSFKSIINNNFQLILIIFNSNGISFDLKATINVAHM